MCWTEFVKVLTLQFQTYEVSSRKTTYNKTNELISCFFQMFILDNEEIFCP